MRVLIWHGWVLEGSGSNVFAARLAEVLRARGHDVALVCQEADPERYAWIDAWATIDGDGPSLLERPMPLDGPTRLDQSTPPHKRAHPASVSHADTPGRCVLLRPQIGDLLPVFVIDRYEGFGTVRRFVDLSDQELEAYLRANVEALRAAVAWHDSQVVIAGHAVPGPVIAARALGPGRYIAKIHGSDLEYAVRQQERYRELAREGLVAATAVVGGSRDVLNRCQALVPEMDRPTRVITPGVDAAVFRPRPRRLALLETADLLDADPSTTGGRRAAAESDLGHALACRELAAIDAGAGSYDQEVPDPGAAASLRHLAESDRPIVGYLGKLIPQKGVELLLAARSSLRQNPIALIVGFGSHRERLAALAIALRERDQAALDWLRASGIDVDNLSIASDERNELNTAVKPDEEPDGADVVFTGRLDHRYAPGAVAAMDVLVVPSVLDEAFGMVAAEGAAAGAPPLVARHSGLAEVAGALETEVGHPGLFSFERGPGAAARLASGIERLLSLPAGERDELRLRVSAFAADTWSWDRTADRLLDAAQGSTSN